VAAILAADAGEDAGRYWLRADPVSLGVDRDRLLMMPPPALSAQESASLLATLRPHLEVEDLQLLAIDAAHWCIGCPAPQDLVCTDPALAVGRDIHPLLPAGKDAARWRRLGTELQMLLHEHPVNKAREARGDMPANSLWLWGGGVRPAIPRSDAGLAATEPLSRALARLSGAAIVSLGADLARTLDAHPRGDLIVVPPGPSGKPEADAAALEADWLSTAWHSIASGRFQRVQLVGQLGNGVIELHADRPARWKFWRRPMKLLAAAGDGR
jgi:hypothetical protein